MWYRSILSGEMIMRVFGEDMFPAFAKPPHRLWSPTKAS
jgi:hypothetical protein